MRRVLVLVLVAATACAPLSQTHHRPGTSHAVATTAPSTQPTAVITITAGRVDPPSGWMDVARGQQVTITVTSDVADELHVHGYDLERELKPGEPATITFTADITGVFEVETHRSELVLTQVAVR
ncbi:MAG: hypothetical protein HOY71_10025 [Nonomuraea sp.]|nr:hypothetical protein [Nonomuraea sp.]